ncbi:MAG: FtsQ-type POTRA domain-containing protein [Limnochordia bacterium]|nr:FtsQ-type POTRA domain-containing protein [Limnochordia bacterium]
MERGQAQDGRFLLSLAIFLALIALFILLGSPLFALREIIVDGGSYFTAEDIWQISGLRKNQNILMVDVEQVQLALLAEPRVSDVCVQLILPHRLQVQLEERTPIALIPYRDVFYLVDRQGRLIGAEATVTESLPFLTGVRLDNPAMGTKPVSHELAVGITVANVLDAVIAEGVSEINVADPTDIRLYMRNLVVVKLGDSLEMKEKLMVLKPLLADLARRSVTPKQIDLSIPNQPVVLQ